MSEIKTVEFTAVYSSVSSYVGTFQFELTENYDELTNRSVITVTAARFKNTHLYGYGGNMHGILLLNGTPALTIRRDSNVLGAYIDVQTSFREIDLNAKAVTVTPVTVDRAADGSLDLSATVQHYGTQSAFAVAIPGKGSFPIPDGTAKTVTFTPYPRASEITSLTSAADTLGSISLIVNPRKSGVKHKVSFSSGGTGLYTSDFFDTSLSVTVPRTWFESFPNTAVLTVTASVQTYNADGTALGDPATGTLTVTADALMKPTVSPGWAAVSPYNSGAVSGFTGYIQGWSMAQAVFDTAKITHASGASLGSLSITCMGATDSTAPYRTGVLTGSTTAVCTVTDSRGRTASESFDLTVMPYARPTVSGISIFRADSTGAADEDGAFFSVRAAINISPLSGQNSGVLKTAFKIKGGSYGAETTLTPGTASVIGTASPDSIYVVRITATDALGETALYEQTVPARAWAMKFRPGGMGVGFGKAPTQDNVLELPAGWSIKIGDSTLTDIIYPVGAIYISTSSADPGTLFGGTWQRIKDRFMLASGDTYASGSTGGEARHTLTVNEMPSHSHTDGVDGVNGLSAATPGQTSAVTYWSNSGGRGTGYTGGGQAHENMPPYIAVYVWKRTA